MKKSIFLLISLFMTIAFSELRAKEDEGSSVKLDTTETFKKDGKKIEFDATETFKKDGKKIEFDATETFKKDNKKSVEFDATTTLDRNKTEETSEAVEKKIKELVPKDPKEAKKLLSKVSETQKLLKEAKKHEDTRSTKMCQKINAGLLTLISYHGGKEVSDKKLYQAYVSCKNIEKDLERIKLNVAVAKRNTPKARKIRKFQRLAKNYLAKAQKAEKQGHKAKAAYYRSCANIKKSVAANLKKEEASKEQIKKAMHKYNIDAAKEYAERFKKRAAKYREYYNEGKAAYYDKAVTLKEKLAEAYAKNNKALVKSIQKEYEALQKTKK